LIALHLAGQEAQEAFGRCLAARLPRPCVVLLSGDLGAGKTTLVRGVLRGFGHRGAVRSPTFTLLEPYDLGDRHLYHLDLYRLGDAEELEYLGLRDLVDEDSLLFVEWPERATDALPAPDLAIRIAYATSGRTLHLEARSPAGERLLAGLDACLPPDPVAQARGPS
jgi:tRNA threonylcarbamoyladenosine biosynthesis protein TsaE